VVVLVCAFSTLGDILSPVLVGDTVTVGDTVIRICSCRTVADAAVAIADADSLAVAVAVALVLLRTWTLLLYLY
jgi:hypothetical protein